MPRAATALAETPAFAQPADVGVPAAGQEEFIDRERALEREVLERELYFGQWEPPPRCAITFNRSLYDATTTIVVDEHAEFAEVNVSQTIAASRHEIARRPEQQRYLESQVARALQHEINDRVQHLTESMAAFAQAAHLAAAHMQNFQEALAHLVYETRHRSGWLGDDGDPVERYEERATISRRLWAEVARRWNQELRGRFTNQLYRTRYAQPDRRLWDTYYAQPGLWDANYYYNQWALSTTNTTNPYQWQEPLLLNNWTTTYANYLAVDVGTAAANTTYTWQTFQDGYINATTGSGSGYQYYQAPVRCDCENRGTCSHCLERARTQELQRRRQQKREQQRLAAAKRGRRLLLSMLDDEQLREYARTQSFVVVAADGRPFRLRKGKTAQLLDAQGRVEASYCIHLFSDRHEQEYVSYVAEDTTIAQLLMLQHEPAEFDRIANITPHSRPTIDPAQAQRYLEEHDREAEAILRAEGIADPRQWVEDLRREVRERYVRGDDVRIVEQGQIRQAIANAVIEDEIFEADLVAEAVAA
jgi:hypothetical protein